ncbi:MAG: ATP-binding protein [Polyangiaceae bacterium]
MNIEDMAWPIPPEIKALLKARPTNAAGEPICKCGTVLRDDQLRCSVCAERADREHEQRQHREALCEKVYRGFATVPDWPWARIGDADFVARTRPKISTACQRYTPAVGNLVMLGPTGHGKTAGAIAIAHRLAGAALESEDAADVRRIAGLFWVSGHELANARRHHGLGEDDAPLIRRAMRSPLLIVDELGFEATHDQTVIPELLHHRYTARLLTIVTSGARDKDLAARYGAAPWRKLCQLGAVIETFA